MMKKFFMILVCLAVTISVWSAPAVKIAPPVWIQGTWTATFDDGETETIKFTANDIVWNDESFSQAAKDEELTAFTQSSSSSKYEFRAEFADFWEKCVLTKSGNKLICKYEDSEGETDEYELTKK
jgi:hypothetical protein